MLKGSVIYVAAFFVILYISECVLQAKEPTHWVSHAVTNLLAEPTEYERSSPVGANDSPKLLAQLLYNEPVAVVRVQGLWSFVCAPTFVVFSHEKYVPLYGWIKNNHLHEKNETVPREGELCLICVAPWTPVYKKIHSNPHKFQHITALSYGTRLKGIEKEGEWWKIAWTDGEEAWVPAPCVMHNVSKTEAELRASIIAHARQFLGGPYCWGGCSAPHASKKKMLTSFDCSGLVYRLLDVAGKSIPRNSRSQREFATLREPAQLQAGDVLFLSVADISPHVCHVMIYTGKGTIIEAWSDRTDKGTMNVQPIREVSVKERLGKPINKIKNGEQVGRYVCYGGTFF